MNRHHHDNHWCANAWVGAPWACGHHSKENFEVDAANMYASQNSVIEGFDCNGLPFTDDSCGSLNKSHCEKTVTTNTGTPSPYLNCQFHKGKCKVTVKGNGNYCPSSCKREAVTPPYNTDLVYEGRSSVQILAEVLQQTTEDNTCKNIRTMFENAEIEWGGDDPISQKIQDCDLYYQRTDVKDAQIGLCKYDESLNTCVASDFVDFIPNTGKLECPLP
jgi:hypothetical protein